MTIFCGYVIIFFKKIKKTCNLSAVLATYRVDTPKKEESIMKKAILLLLALLCTLSLMACEPIDDKCEINQMIGEEPLVDKPVIYLYPTEETEVSVKLEYDGEFIATYPKYDDGWEVIASPDGTLTSLDGEREYYCLFWEGKSGFEYDLSRGFVVAGKDTEKLREKNYQKT